VSGESTWQRLSTGDLMTLWAQTPSAPMNIAVLGLLPAGSWPDGTGAPRLEALRSAVADRLDRTPALRRRVRGTRFGEGRPIWVDDAEFDVARHVDAIDLPGTEPERLLSWAAAEAARGLPAHRPMWRLTFVTGLDTGEIGVLLVVHHAIADGMTGVALATALFDAAPDERPPPTTWAPAPSPTARALAADAAAGRLQALARLVSGSHGRSGLGRDLRSTRNALGEPAPALGLPVPGDGGRRAVASSWPLHVVRDAAHRHDVTVNDLMLAAVTAGMRGLLLAREVPVADLVLRVSVPVAAPPGTRNAGGTLPLVLSLPVGDEDPVSILRRVNADSRHAKAGRDRGYAGPAHSPLFPLFVVRLGIRWLRRHGSERINLYVTNVPGPRGPLWFCGARLGSVYPLAPVMAGVPLAVAVLSYDDHLCLTVNADPRLELRPFTEGANRAVEQLTAKRPARAGTAPSPAAEVAPTTGGRG
jgi:diacylglycerol O-acyltransferase / wax synthase